MARRTRAPRRSTALLAAPILLALLGMLLHPAAVLAHANLDHSDPADGATLASAPAIARLWFTEDLEPAFSRAVVTDEAGAAASTGNQVAPDDPRLLIVDLGPNLGPGWYTISWQALARIDGHVTVGTVVFGVGVAGPSPPLAAAESAARSGSGAALDVALRWLIVLSATAVVGAFPFWLVQGLVRPVGLRRPRILPLQWALAELAWILFTLANVVFLANAVALASPASTLDDLGPPLLRLATQTAFGQLWVVRMVLAAGLGLVLLGRGTSLPSGWDLAGLALGAALLLSFSLASHSAALPTLAPLAVANDWLHFAAATVWLGGLFQLAIVLAPGPEKSGASPVYSRHEVVHRFAWLAGYAVAAVAITGLVQAAFHVGTPANLVETRYGQVVLLKTLLLVPLMILVATHRRFILAFRLHPPGNPKLDGSPQPPTGKLVPTLARLVRYEALWAVVLLAAVGLLTSLSPP